MDRISATRRIPAPAHDIFVLVSDPAGQVRIDGSGMLVTAPDARPVQAVGDTFVMDMDRASLGDFPEMGKYTMLNTITRIEPDRLLEWAPGGVGRTPLGHLYGYELTSVNDTETDVTSYCDWSAIPDKWRSRANWPVVPVEMIEASLERLEQVVLSPDA